MNRKLIWVLVADAGRARFFSKSSSQFSYVERHDLEINCELPRTSQMMTDRLDRTHESTGNVRHAVDRHTDPHRELKRLSARKIVDVLSAGLRSESFDQLIIVAPPQFLGDLRSAMPSAIYSRVSGEFPNDMTKVPEHALIERLDAMISAAGIK